MRGRYGKNWRRMHAKIIKLMEKLWSKNYPRVINRRVVGRIEEAITEIEEEQDQQL